MQNSMLRSNLKTNAILFVKNEQGTTAIEYSVIASLISVVIVTAVSGIGDSVNDLFFNRLIALF